MNSLKGFAKSLGYWLQWLWDWYLLPIWEAVIPSHSSRPAPEDRGQTLDEE